MKAFKWREGNVFDGLEKRPVLGGTDSDGSLIYVGRAFHNGQQMPAKIMPSKHECYVSKFRILFFKN